MNDSKTTWCRCGHPQSFHRSGHGACRCGCERLHVHARGAGVEVLALVDVGDPPRLAPIYRVRCPDCERVYETRAYLRDLALRARCRTCSDARRRAKRKAPEALAPAPGDLPKGESYGHGVRARYVTGCRCAPCAEANRVYSRAQQKLARMGQGNPLVSAAAARRHIAKLAAAGVGRHQIADAAQTAASAIHEIRHGRKTQIRRQTEARILAVTVEAKADGAFVDGGRTWSILERLLADGFTRQELARRLGSKAKVPALQVRRDCVLLKTQAAVERLYREIHGVSAPKVGRPKRGHTAAPIEAAE